MKNVKAFILEEKMRNLSISIIYILTYLCLSAANLCATEHIRKEMADTLPYQAIHYLNKLPKIDRNLSNENPTKKAKEIIKFICQFFPVTKRSERVKEKLTGMDQLVDRFLFYLSDNKKIIMCLPAFPFKSLNIERRVLSHNADMGELVAILTLNHICCEIGLIYLPGAVINIFSDGAAFKSLFPISDVEYHTYQSAVCKIIAPFSDRLKFITPSENEYKTFLTQIYLLPLPTSKDKIKYMTIFAREEMKCVSYVLRQESPPLTPTVLGYLLELNSVRYQLFLKTTVPGYEDMIRLSVHPHEDISQKLGISLIYGSRGTPWHNTLVMDDHTVSLQKLQDLPYRSTRIMDRLKTSKLGIRYLMRDPKLIHSWYPNLEYVSYLHSSGVPCIAFIWIHTTPAQTFAFEGVDLGYVRLRGRNHSS